MNNIDTNKQLERLLKKLYNTEGMDCPTWIVEELIEILIKDRNNGVNIDADIGSVGQSEHCHEN